MVRPPGELLCVQWCSLKFQLLEFTWLSPSHAFCCFKYRHSGALASYGAAHVVIG
jgi:hypothetical protein